MLELYKIKTGFIYQKDFNLLQATGMFLLSTRQRFNTDVVNYTQCKTILLKMSNTLILNQHRIFKEILKYISPKPTASFHTIFFKKKT